MATQELLPSGSLGIAVAVDGTERETAAVYEDLGYDTLWIAGGQLDRLERVTELVGATRTVRVATGVAPLGMYAVDQLAALYHSLPPGRLVLGLGAPQRPRALTALNAALDGLDAAGVPAGQRLLAALGPRKIALARDRTAGAITLLVTPESTAATRTVLGPGPLLV
ncbi:MAG: LLM class flavin-dependent oxidoreductase, partial [Actinobacteria bacterium]|nr:LLM class flavin-dependent oxidoreductase [Actinomycetota bacterium]